MKPQDAILLSWRSGRAGFGAWHVARRYAPKNPLCGIVIPDAAAVCESPNGLKMYSAGIIEVDLLCRSCLELYALEPDPFPRTAA